MERCDFVVLGAGIAGASAAYELAESHTVIVLEAESAPGYHTTGRSAAMYAESYGNEIIRALSTASGAFFRNPPPDFARTPLLSPRGALFIGRADQASQLAAVAAMAPPGVLQTLSADQARALVPILEPGPQTLDGAVLDPRAQGVDVDALLQGYLGGLRRRDGRLVTKARAQAITRRGRDWIIETPAGVFSAPVLINAAGAWADQVAALAGVPGVGLAPKRRTAAIVDAPADTDVSGWPAVVDVDEQFYFMPDAGRLMISPADETPSPPCDAQPEDIDVATGIARVEAVTSLEVKQVRHKWAGLRSFVADSTPVVGFDAEAPGFFWLAGQGGYGIQTAPALARTAAALARGKDIPGDVARLGVTAEDLSPTRLSRKRL